MNPYISLGSITLQNTLKQPGARFLSGKSTHPKGFSRNQGFEHAKQPGSTDHCSRHCSPPWGQSASARHGPVQPPSRGSSPPQRLGGSEGFHGKKTLQNPASTGPQKNGTPLRYRVLQGFSCKSWKKKRRNSWMVILKFLESLSFHLVKFWGCCRHIGMFALEDDK